MNVKKVKEQDKNIYNSFDKTGHICKHPNEICHWCSLSEVPYFTLYNALPCIMRTHILCTLHMGLLDPWYVTITPMYNMHPYFSLKNLGKKVCIIHGKIRYFCKCVYWSRILQNWRIYLESKYFLGCTRSAPVLRFSLSKSLLKYSRVSILPYMPRPCQDGTQLRRGHEKNVCSLVSPEKTEKMSPFSKTALKWRWEGQNTTNKMIRTF